MRKNVKIISGLLFTFIVMLTLISTIISLPVHASDDVCQIDGTGYATLSGALDMVGTGETKTIELLQDIDYESGITIENKNITIKTNGFKLNINNSDGNGLTVSYGNLYLDDSGGGELNVTGTYCGIYADQGNATVTNAIGTNDNEDDTYGVYSTGGSSVTVKKDVLATSISNWCYGIYSIGGSQVTVYGDLQSNTAGVLAGEASTVEIKGNILCQEHGISTESDGCTINVGGNITANGGYGAFVNSSNSTIMVGGNVNANQIFAVATKGTGSSLTVGGNITGSSENGVIGAWAESGTITINGTITAPYYVRVGLHYLSKNDYQEPTTKDGYLTYSNDGNTVWIKISDICQIDGIGFNTLEDALNSIDDGETKTIELLQDIHYNSYISIENRNITFKLNGYNLNVAGGEDAGLIVYNNGNVYLDDSGGGEFNVTGGHRGVYVNSGNVTVTNAIASNNIGANALAVVAVGEGGIVYIKNDVIADSTGTDTYGVFAFGGSKITVDGNLESSSYGVGTGEASTVEVKGNINSNWRGVFTYEENCTITVGGDITADSGYGVYNDTGSIVTVDGNVTSGGDYGIGVFGTDGTVTVGGNVTALNGIGAYATNGSDITIDGIIIANNYIKVGDSILTPADHNINSSKDGYLTYTTDRNFVWVKIGGFWTDDGICSSTPPYLSGTIYTIYNAAELAWVAVEANEGNDFSGYTIKLGNDIDLAAHYWTPIGLNERLAFKGIFDGNDKTISYLTISLEDEPDSGIGKAGLFGLTNGAEIYDLELADVLIYSDYDSDIGSLAAGISNTLVTDCHVSGNISGSDINGDIGGLLGNADDYSEIKYSDANVNVAGGGVCYIGGLVGGLDSAKITNCFATGDVIGGDAGGLVGYSSYNTINDCYATGNITGNYQYRRVGGFIGYDYRSVISNCYATGDTTLNAIGSDVGGFIGQAGRNTLNNAFWNSDANQTLNGIERNALTKVGVGTLQEISDEDTTTAQASAYMQSADFVTLLNENKTGDIAWQLDSGSENNGYPVFDISGSGNADQDAPTGLNGIAPTSAANDDGMITGTTTEMEYKMSTATVWTSVEGTSITGLPAGIYAIRYAAKPGYNPSPSALVVVPEFSDYYWNNPGNYASNPPDLSGTTYTIDNAQELSWVAIQVNEEDNDFSGYTIKLNNNIDLSAYFWIPIGDGGHCFSGIFDGNEKTISGLYIGTLNDRNNDLQFNGLFGNLSGATVSDLTLDEIAVYSSFINSYTGGLVGWASDSSITNCSAEGIVSAGNGANCGGLIGVADEILISDSVTSCSVFVGEETDGYFPCAGGLVGVLVSGTLDGCSTEGEVEGGDFSQVGGLIGYTVNSSSIINCSSIGYVTGAVYGSYGGLAGGFTGLITNSYATGDVWGGAASFTGGLAGYLNGSITNCYASVYVSCGDEFEYNSETYVGCSGGLVGFAEDSSIINSYATENAHGGDFAMVGGLVGLLTGTGENCYATGDTSGGQDAAVGGLFGIISDCTVNHCYWNSDAVQRIDGSVIAQGSKTGVGLCGDDCTDNTTAKTSAEMKNPSFIELLNNYVNASSNDLNYWAFIAGSNDGYPVFHTVYVTSITVAGSNNATSVEESKTLQMEASVLPENASNNSVTWSVTNGSGKATINATSGLLTGKSEGMVTVTATAKDGSGINGNTNIEITASSGGSTGGGGGGVGGGGSSIFANAIIDGKSIMISYEADGSTITLNLTRKIMNDLKEMGLLEDGLELDLSNISRAKELLLPSDTGIFDTESLTIVFPALEVRFDQDTLILLKEASDGGDISITAKVVASSVLTQAQKDEVGDNPVYDVTVLADGTQVSELGGELTVTIPYILSEGADPDNIVVWYLKDDGELVQMSCTYDEETESVSFVTDHLSYYTVIYSEGAAWNNPFNDVSDKAWYYDAVAYANQHGLFKGVSANTFDPNGSTTRAMVVTVLWRMAGEPAAGASNFSDVKDGVWYADAVTWAAENGIVNGVGDGLFKPDANITREQLAVILYNYADFMEYDMSGDLDTNIPSYDDATNISQYAYSSLGWACGSGLIEGDGGKLDPKGQATRAQISAILMRFMENIAE